VLPPALLDSGNAKGSVRKRSRHFGMSTASSPKGLTPLTSRRRRHCWQCWRENTGEDNLVAIHFAQHRCIIHHPDPPRCTSCSTLSVTYAMMHAPMSPVAKPQAGKGRH
jgi:hypothetical protein